MTKKGQSSSPLQSERGKTTIEDGVVAEGGGAREVGGVHEFGGATDLLEAMARHDPGVAIELDVTRRSCSTRRPAVQPS